MDDSTGSQHTWDGTIVFTEADIAELVRLNPLAAEQLKSIALRRKVAELEQRLAEATAEDPVRWAGEEVP